jgi:hypothetical protein
MNDPFLKLIIIGGRKMLLWDQTTKHQGWELCTSGNSLPS